MPGSNNVERKKKQADPLAKKCYAENLTVHSIVVILKIYNNNSGFVTGWHYMPSSLVKNLE